jgi:hypothetical protein
MKDHDLDPKDSGLLKPYHVLLHRLTGTSIRCPRMRSAMNLWRHTEAPIIEAEVRCLVLEVGTVTGFGTRKGQARGYAGVRVRVQILLPVRFKTSPRTAKTVEK